MYILMLTDLVQWQRVWIMYSEIQLADILNTEAAISELSQSMFASYESDKHGNVCLGLWRQDFLYFSHVLEKLTRNKVRSRKKKLACKKSLIY